MITGETKVIKKAAATIFAALFIIASSSCEKDNIFEAVRDGDEKAVAKFLKQGSSPFQCKLKFLFGDLCQ